MEKGAATKRPSAVLFDVGNVIVRWDPRTLYSKIFPDPKELDFFLSEVCTSEWHVQVDVGRTFAENIAELKPKFPQYAAAIEAWWSRWPEMFSGNIAQTEEAIEALYAMGVPLYALTNMSNEAWPVVQAMSPVFERFRDTIVSGFEKIKKPDRRIFDLVCERSGLQPADFLFVDDHEPNIDAAKRLGFHVHFFDDPNALEPALKSYGLL
jgi:FMN phosphatase YigB (HAD superfamily)